MKAIEIRNKYLNFFKRHGHSVIPSAPVIPENDPSVLFTTAGMHPLVPYLLGSKHPMGTRLANSQTCLRTNDIDEVLDIESITVSDELAQKIRTGQKINNEFRGMDKPTDVLSFPLVDYDGIDALPIDDIDGSLGDVVISLERAKEQSEEFGHSFEREIAFLTVHSMLHLLGYDHVNSEEEELDMRKRQSDVLKLMGLDVK